MPVLDEFEAKGWPRRIDVYALVPKGRYSKLWVSNTVQNLNRNLRGIRFHADGPNHSIAWGAA
jgi:hypothetical protein